MSANDQQHYDIVVIGAGLWGLCAAHTFLTIEPTLKLLIVERKASVGGVWATEQLYPGLRANNLQGYYEFTDFPLLDAGLGIHPRGVLHGETLGNYLHRYAENFDLLPKTRLETLVVRAEEVSGDFSQIWKLELLQNKDRSTITTSKLVVATGQASMPLPLSFDGQLSFQKMLIHSADLGQMATRLIKDQSVQKVTVIGGSKSAHDAVYMFAVGGKHVTWITHKNGRGTMPMALPYTQIGPWSVWLEGLLMTRPLSWFGIAPWSTGDGFAWVRWLLHQTAVGRKLVKAYFKNMTDEAALQSGILKSEKTKVLVPDETLMWYGTQASSLNYDTDFYKLIRDGKVDTYRANISNLSAEAVHLDTGETITTDAVVAAIGYDYSATVPLFPIEKRLGWGCPVPTSEDDQYSRLDARADKELFARFPALRDAPRQGERLPAQKTPWRLYRFIAPPSQVALPATQRTLVFLNAITCYQTTLKAELTSLWAWAYLHDQLPGLPNGVTEQEARYEAALWSRFGKWRAPYGMQGLMADLLYDAVPYYDCLLRDLGCRSWRKGWGLLGEIFSRWYAPADYRGVIHEWMQARDQYMRPKIE